LWDSDVSEKAIHEGYLIISLDSSLLEKPSMFLPYHYSTPFYCAGHGKCNFASPGYALLFFFLNRIYMFFFHTLGFLFFFKRKKKSVRKGTYIPRQGIKHYHSNVKHLFGGFLQICRVVSTFFTQVQNKLYMGEVCWDFAAFVLEKIIIGRSSCE
jgi:hypothetical protein